jgi:hypothetical protein
MADSEVTGILWNPPDDEAPGPGEVTLGHRTGDDIKTPMRLEEAHRMADQFFGEGVEVVPTEGSGVLWVRHRESR